MKNSFYFDHDYNAKGDQKILCLRAKYNWNGYGLFFATLECLCESGGFIVREALSGVSLGLNTPEIEYTSFIDYCIQIKLLTEDERGIFSNRILRHLEYRKDLSEAGKRGGRGKKKNEIKPPFNLPLATLEAVKESKGEKSKESRRNVFIIPSVEDVKKYFKENGFTETSAKNFFNYYSSAEWKDSTGKQVRAWKQKAHGIWFKPVNKINGSAKKTKQAR
ncbi:DUF4373 domain-containing protein [bacterium]|nr:MAG: DUF4373 domain-containing protein [bacterium]